MSPPPLALGIDLGGTKIEAAVLRPDGTQVWRERVATPAGDYTATLQALAQLVQRAEAETGSACTVGVGHPGSLTPAGLVKNANSTCLNGRPLQSDLQALLARPVRLANDANCLALSEATDGAGQGAEVVFAVILGTGTGAGIVAHGRLLPGVNRLAGEWGHNPLPWTDSDEMANAARCYCGHSGCNETWLSGPAMAHDHLKHTGQAWPGEQIAAAAKTGDASAQATLDRHAHRLARALAAVINLLDPDVIVLGGGLSQLPGLAAQVTQQWSRWVFSAGTSELPRTRLLPALHGSASGVRGAAWLWLGDASTPGRPGA